MEKKITEIIKKHATEENIEDNSNLRSLGLDSLDVVELEIDIEQNFNFTFSKDMLQIISANTTVEQLIDYTKSQKQCLTSKLDIPYPKS